jgi:hypothetical protein
MTNSTTRRTTSAALALAGVAAFTLIGGGPAEAAKKYPGDDTVYPSPSRLVAATTTSDPGGIRRVYP